MTMNNINLPSPPAWRALGRNVEDAVTAEEAIQLGNLDYEVGLGEVYVKLDNETANHIGSEASQIPNTFATYRKDTGYAFSVVGSRYEVVQNNEVFQFFDQFIQDGIAEFETAGYINNGATVFLSAKMTHSIDIEGLPNEKIDTYVLLINSHDGSAAVQVILTPMRIACWNQLPGLGTSNRISVKHTKSAHDKIDDVMNMMDSIKDFVDETSQLYSRLATIKVTDKEVKDFYNRVLLTQEEYREIKDTGNYRRSKEISQRKKNILDDVNRAYVIGFGQDDIIGTMYGAVNGIIHYYQNMKNYSDSEAKMKHMFLGGGDSKVINKAIQFALTYKHNV